MLRLKLSQFFVYLTDTVPSGFPLASRPFTVHLVLKGTSEVGWKTLPQSGPVLRSNIVLIHLQATALYGEPIHGKPCFWRRQERGQAGQDLAGTLAGLRADEWIGVPTGPRWGNPQVQGVE